MEEAWEFAVVSSTKRFYEKELARQAAMMEAIPEDVLSSIYEAREEAELAKQKAEAIRTRSRLTSLASMLAMLLAVMITIFSAIGFGTFEPIKVPGLDNSFFDNSLTAMMAGVSISLLAALLIAFFRNVRVGISSDDEISFPEGDDEVTYRTIKSKLLGIEFTTRTKKKVPVRETISVFDDALLASPNATWKDALINAKKLILKENGRLAARSRGNLAVGIVIAMVGVVYLLAIVFFPNIFPSVKPDAPSEWLPRFSLFFFIQLFAVFFLRLYVGNEKRLQRNIEEITNLHLRIASGIMPLDQNQKTHILADKLATEDRCITAKKIESDRTPKEYFSTLSEAIKLGKDLK